MSLVVPYLYYDVIFIVPGRLFSTLSFYIYSVVYSSGEFKKYFATPLRPPFAGLFWYIVGVSLPLLEGLYRNMANAFTLLHR
jgi:hypothetical protein